jgi:hypothetical protein
VLRDAGEAAEGGHVLGVRETRDAESWSMLFMECIDAEDKQEVALGMDTYCLVVDPGQANITAASANARSTISGCGSCSPRTRPPPWACPLTHASRWTSHRRRWIWSAAGCAEC